MCFMSLFFTQFATLKIVLIAARLLHMFDTDMKTLHDDTMSHLFRHLDTDGGARDVKHTPGLALVELVRHALQHRGIDMNVHIVADLEHLQVGRRVLGAGLSERLLKQVPRVRALTIGTHHLDVSVLLLSLLGLGCNDLFSQCLASADGDAVGW